MNMLTRKLREILKILWKRGKKEQFLLFSTIFCRLLVDHCFKTGDRFSLRYKRLFEISEVEITRVDCLRVLYLVSETHIITITVMKLSKGLSGDQKPEQKTTTNRTKPFMHSWRLNIVFDVFSMYPFESICWRSVNVQITCGGVGLS